MAASAVPSVTVLSLVAQPHAANSEMDTLRGFEKWEELVAGNPQLVDLDVRSLCGALATGLHAGPAGSRPMAPLWGLTRQAEVDLHVHALLGLLVCQLGHRVDEAAFFGTQAGACRVGWPCAPHVAVGCKCRTPFVQHVTVGAPLAFTPDMRTAHQDNGVVVTEASAANFVTHARALLNSMSVDRSGPSETRRTPVEKLIVLRESGVTQAVFLLVPAASVHGMLAVADSGMARAPENYVGGDALDVDVDMGVAAMEGDIENVDVTVMDDARSVGGRSVAWVGSLPEDDSVPDSLRAKMLKAVYKMGFKEKKKGSARFLRVAARRFEVDIANLKRI